MLAYRQKAGAIFGRVRSGDKVEQKFLGRSLIVEDELHRIAAHLGTMYSIYEGVIVDLCSHLVDGLAVVTKIIASPATIRGAGDHSTALYARKHSSGEANFHLFPSPGLTMGDSFFGV